MWSFSPLSMSLLIGSSVAVPFLSGSGRYGTATNTQATLDETNIKWQPAMSTKGVPFEIGVKSYRDTVHHSCETTANPKGDFGLVVNWPFDKNDDWKSTRNDVQDTAAITRYSLYSSSSPIYDYVLEITNMVDYNYRFYDQTGDSYQINTYEEGDHLVRYNSEKPKVVFITGS
ncbi:MAG: hypothetical protein Q9180_009210 [Flavoplaca navasiana]